MEPTVEDLSPINDTWDWPKLLYIGTVMLRRTEKQFWRMTPRKLNALSKAHTYFKGGDGKSGKREQPTTGYVDQIY